MGDDPVVEGILGWMDRLELDPVITLPCKYTGGLIQAVAQVPGRTHLPCTREEEGVGMACGAYLGGKHPLMVFQNSGMGNLVNAVASLSQLYRIPLLFFLSHRGTPGEAISAQVPMGRLVPRLLDVLEIDACEVASPGELDGLVGRVMTNRTRQVSTALLLPISFWSTKGGPP